MQIYLITCIRIIANTISMKQCKCKKLKLKKTNKKILHVNV